MAAGFECDFVAEPQKAFQSECPICLLVLREPYQVTCRGKSFCKVCIEQAKAKTPGCPACKVENFDLFHNKGLEQSLYDFQVHCSTKDEGCEWTGELRELDKHLNSDPPADKSLEGCPFEIIDCPLSYMGCKAKLARKDMKTHLDREVVSHVLLQARKQNLLLASMETLHQENQGLRTLLGEIQAEKQYLEQRLTELEAKMVGVPHTLCRQPVSVVEFIMDDFEKMKKERVTWYSPPFYTHQQGYKMCLGVNASGLGEGRDTHLSVYAHMMGGEFDDHLKWPFRGCVTILLLDQAGNKEHFTHTFYFTDAVPTEASGRQRYGERSSRGRGPSKFIPLADLRPKYLKNDCLTFRVVKAELKYRFGSHAY